MIYIGIGIFGFLVMNVFDLVSLKKTLPGLKPLIWTAGCALLIFSLVMLCLDPNTFTVSAWVGWAGWFLLAVSLIMITLALFVNLPFRKTYVESGASNRLVRTGLYALVRHPGVYWVAAFFFSLVLVSGSYPMLIAAPIYVFLNTLFVIIEDRYYFVKMFEGYREYQRETPMLVPNRRSIKAFVDSIKHTGSST